MAGMAILRALSGLMIASVALWSLGRVSSWCWTVFESLVSLQPGLPGFRVLWRRISDKSDQDGTTKDGIQSSGPVACLAYSNMLGPWCLRGGGHSSFVLLWLYSAIAEHFHS